MIFPPKKSKQVICYVLLFGGRSGKLQQWDVQAKVVANTMWWINDTEVIRFRAIITANTAIVPAIIIIIIAMMTRSQRRHETRVIGMRVERNTTKNIDEIDQKGNNTILATMTLTW